MRKKLLDYLLQNTMEQKHMTNDNIDQNFVNAREANWTTVASLMFDKLGGTLMYAPDNDNIICIYPLALRVSDDGTKDNSYFCVITKDFLIGVWACLKAMNGLEQAYEVIQEGKTSGNFSGLITEYCSIRELIETIQTVASAKKSEG